MSKLAAVHTGQPTQGHGTVPNGKPKVAPAPRTIEDIDSELQALAAIPPAAINPRSAHSAAAATVAAAWLSLSATELEVRNYFRAVAVPSGLEMLAKMRHQCELAATTIQGRMDEGNLEHCTGCGKTLEEARKTQWIMQGSEVDPETGVPMPYRFCGPMCVRERNREKMLPKDQRNKFRVDGQEEGDIR
jgi:heterodisulfide reductase subunit A-like polyferredoxin